MADKPDQQISIPDMLQKLNLLYDKKELIENQVALLYRQYKQVTEDIELAQMIIMYQSNRLKRKHG